MGSWPLKAEKSKRYLIVFNHRFAKRRLVRYGLVAANSLILIAVVTFVYMNHSSAQIQFSTTSSSSPNVINPIDQLASASIALTVAHMDNLPETTAVSNQADSEEALLSIAPANNSVTVKPEVVSTNYVSNKDIKTYVVQTGDNITSIAQKFNISVNSILWSNNISGNYVTPGVKLLIPPVSGIVYTVKAGDTPASLAKKYNSSESLLIAYNDAEIKGIYTGERIIIPNGTEPSAVAPIVSASYGWGYQATYGYNGYDYGYCTWWVANKRAQAGHPLPTDLGNAATWAIRAAEFGLPVGTAPAVGAAVVLSTTADYGQGHVAYVTAVHPDGTMTISEMNYLGWDIPDTRVIPSAGYEYIY